MNNKFYFDNIFLIDTHDNLFKILNILNTNNQKKNLVITNKGNNKVTKTIKKFTNVKYFYYIDEKIVFGSKKKSILGRILDHIIIFLNLFFFGIKYRFKLSKFNCCNLFYFSPVHLLTFRYLINIINHKKLNAYKIFNLKFLAKEHFLSPIYSFFFKFKLDKCKLSYRDDKNLPAVVGFNFRFRKLKKEKNSIFFKKFVKDKKKSILFIEDSFEQVNKSYNNSVDEKITLKNFEDFFKVLSKNNFTIYYKTHPSYKKKTRLFKLLYKRFYKNIILLDNLVPSEIYIDNFDIISSGTTSTHRSYFNNKIILNFKNLYKFNNSTYEKYFNSEFKSNLSFKTKRDNKFFFLEKNNFQKLNKFFS